MLNGDLVNVGVGRDLLHAEPEEFTTGDGLHLGIQIAFDDRVLDWYIEYEGEADVLAVADPPVDVDGESLFTSGFQYLKADRIVPSVTFPKSHEAVTVLKWLGPSGEHAPNFLRVHGDLATLCVETRHPKVEGSGLLDHTNGWLDELSPGTGMAVEDIPGTDFVRLTFTRSGPEVRTQPHRSTNVGFGLTYALPVIVACLSSTPESLLVVENPEAHLHPAGQALVGRLCALASVCGAQVILETHSDHVLNAIRLSAKRDEVDSENVVIHFFSREDGVLQPRVETMRLSPDGSIAKWPSGFFDQWDRALDELLD
jgi:predicted ATPase